MKSMVKLQKSDSSRLERFHENIQLLIPILILTLDKGQEGITKNSF